MKWITYALMVLLVVSIGFAAEDGEDPLIVTGGNAIVSLINQDPDPAQAGDVIELRIGLENQGQESYEDIVMEIIPSYPFLEVAGEPLVERVGTVRAYQVGSDMKIIKFKVRIDRDAVEGGYELKVWMYEDGKREQYRGERRITIDVKSRESAEVIYIDKVELLPGEITPMTFTINNVGSAPLRDLTFRWADADGTILPVGSGDAKYVKYIDVGEDVRIVYNVLASSSADPDLYKLTLTLTYDDPLSDEEKIITTIAGVYVGGETDFDVAYSGSSRGETSFSVSNIGSVAANSITVSVPDQQGWRVSGSKSVIIGNLNEGDYTVASFTIRQVGGQTADTPDGERQARREQFGQGGSSASSSVKVEIAYTDTRGQRHTVAKEVTVDPTTLRASTAGGEGQPQIPGEHFGPQQQSSRWPWYAAGTIVLVLIVFGHKRYKRGKLGDPSYTYMRMLRDIYKPKRRR